MFPSVCVHAICHEETDEKLVCELDVSKGAAAKLPYEPSSAYTFHEKDGSESVTRMSSKPQARYGTDELI